MQQPQRTTPLAACNWGSLTRKVVWQKGHWVRSCDIAVHDDDVPAILTHPPARGLLINYKCALQSYGSRLPSRRVQSSW